MRALCIGIFRWYRGKMLIEGGPWEVRRGLRALKCLLLSGAPWLTLLLLLGEELLVDWSLR